MKKNLITLTQRVGILLSILCCLLGCRKELDPCVEQQEEKQEERLADPVVEAARLFHKDRGGDLSVLFAPRPSPASRSTSPPLIRWEAATVEENSLQVSVFAPLSSGGMDSVVLKTSQDQHVVNKKVAITSRLVVRKNKQLNFTHQYLTSTLQIVSPGVNPLSRTSTGAHTLTFEYNTEHQLISIHENKDGKFRLMTLAKDDEPGTEAYEVEIGGGVQKVVPYSTMRICPFCGDVLINNMCQVHGYIIEDVEVIGEINRTIINIYNRVKRIIGNGIGYHLNQSHLCTKYCTTYIEDVEMMCGSYLMNEGSMSSMLKPIGEETHFFTRPWIMIPSGWDQMILDQDWHQLIQYLDMYFDVIAHDLADLIYEYEQYIKPVDPGGGTGGDTGGGTGGESGEGSGEGTGGNPDPTPDPLPPLEDSTCMATLTVSKDFAFLMEEYNITYTINASTPLNIESAEIQMSRKGKDDWKIVAELSSSQRSYTRKAITPGHWDIRAEIVVVENGERRQITTKTMSVEESFPDLNMIRSHINLEEKAKELWNKTKSIASDRRLEHAVQEVGCFIYLDTRTGKYFFGGDILGDVVYLVGNVEATVGFRWDERYLDPREPCAYEVAGLHSHYPLTWAVQGSHRPPGPSNRDLNFEMPGIVYDYTEEVSAGDDPDCYEKTFYPYGPPKRMTPQL